MTIDLNLIFTQNVAISSTKISPFMIMSILMANLFLLLLLLFLFPCRIAATSCHTKTCSSSFIPIRFPFRIEGVHPQNCGCPGFNLSCNSQGKAALKLPNSVEFFVSDIDYQWNSIVLYDPEGCLPRKLRELDLSGSPFFSSFQVNYTFLSCQWKIDYLLPVPCLSNSSTDTDGMAANYSTPIEYLLSSNICDEMFTLAVSTTSPTDNFMLSWSPDNFKCNASEQIWDRDTHNTGHVKKGLIPGMIFMSIGLLIIFMVIVRCSALHSNRRNGGVNLNNLHQGSNSTVVSNGLDESTIASFTEVILGESRRLPGPNDNTCPICLSEYQSMEVLRCIPECKHCFHAKCIDEWFKKNITCPVCRNCLNPYPSS